MGCNESKPKVATGNTITRKKSSKRCGESNKSEEIEPVLEASNINGDNNNINEPLLQQEDDEKVTNIVDTKGDENVTVFADEANDAKDVAESRAKKEEDEAVNLVANKEKEEQVNLICKESPNHFFSSRKDEEALEGIASSEKSEYNSPRIVESGKDNLLSFNENVKEFEAVEEEKVVEEAKQEEETKTVTGEPSNEKKVEEETTTEAEVSIPSEEQNTTLINADEKKQTEDSSAKDVKTE